MNKKEKEVKEVKEVEVKEEKEVKTPKKSKVESVTVLSATGNVVRTYTEEMTDKDKGFEEKAKGYAKKIGGSTREA